MGEVAERAKLAGRRLIQWVENERRVVTYRELSREVRCHVNEAKNLLLEHYTAHPSLYPTYLLTGPLLPTSSLAQTALGGDTGPSLPSSSLAHLGNTQKVKIVDMDEMSEDERNSEPADEMDRLDDPDLQGNDRGAEDGLEGDVHLRGVKRDEEEVRPEVVERRGVVLVGKDGLEDKVALFRPGEVTVHIYALSPGPVNDPAQYLVSSDNARNHRDYHKPSIYGTITGEGFKPSEAAMKDGAMSWDKKEVKATSKPAAVAVTATSAAKEKEKEKEKEKPKPKQVEVKVKQEKQEPEPKAHPKPPAKAERSVSGKKKRVIESDDEADEPEAGPSKPTEPSSSQRRADDAAAMEAMMSMDVDMDDEMDDGPSASPKAAERVTVKTEPGAKKKRKVKKSVSEVNDKGYMVTKDVWVEEEYSGDDEPQPAHKPPQSMSRSASNSTDSSEKRPQVKPAPRPPPNKPAAGGGGARRPGGQSTLQGFFKKK